ncbi:MAG: chorismate synthase [Actinobacteria bacterium]|nr:chorismate synthase [Actinomycetota bacterium]
MLRYLTSGESHGPCLVSVIEGLPAGLKVLREDIDRHLSRRQSGYGRGGRMKIEADRAEIVSGIRHGYTIGSPVTIIIKNRDWDNWVPVMTADQTGEDGLKAVTRPRPGHADLTGVLKYDRGDARDILERASARETAARVAAGAVARKLLEELGVTVVGHVVSIGSMVTDTSGPTMRGAAIEGPTVGGLTATEIASRAEESPVRCADPEASARMVAEIDGARNDGDSLGGVVEVIAEGLPPGLGSHVQWDRKLDGRLARALMSIQSVKGVEVGLGFEAARRRGSGVHDEIFHDPLRGFYRQTNNAGGLEGGMTNGGALVVRAAMKPIATLYRPLRTVDICTKESQQASVERSDICAVPAGAVIAEAAVAFELAGAVLEKFGGDSMAELTRNYRSYLEQLKARY